jgi:CBS domain containing-hemolysin-like protein
MRPIWDFSHVGSYFIRLFVEIIISTFIVLVFAELIPRAIFRARSNVYLSGMARVIDFFYQMFHPLASGLITLSEWLLKYVFNVRVDEQKEVLGRGDLENLFQQSKNDHDENHELNTELFENKNQAMFSPKKRNYRH